MVITSKTIAAEDEAAYDGLEQIVGKTHATEDAKVMEHTTNALESIPGRNYCRDNHQQNDDVVDGLQPEVQLAEIRETQRKDYDSRAKEDAMPYLQMAPLVVEQPLSSQLHAEDE